MYPVNEIFYSLQGEGCHAGRPAVFIRFSGCNLKCPFCDTDHSRKTMMSADEIIDEISRYNCHFVVLTGGEPSLFIDKNIIDALHKADAYIAIETNGTHPIDVGIDWITLSPKYVDSNQPCVVKHCNELKLVWQEGCDPGQYNDIDAVYRFLQPCDTGNDKQNMILRQQAINYCMSHPQWRLSLQLHKILNIK